VIGAWLLTLAVVVTVSGAIGSRFNSNFNLPNTDSQAAVSSLTENLPTATGEGDQVVIQATGAAIVRSRSVRRAVTVALAKVHGVGR